MELWLGAVEERGQPVWSWASLRLCMFDVATEIQLQAHRMLALASVSPSVK